MPSVGTASSDEHGHDLRRAGHVQGATGRHQPGPEDAGPGIHGADGDRYACWQADADCQRRVRSGDVVERAERGRELTRAPSTRSRTSIEVAIAGPTRPTGLRDRSSARPVRAGDAEVLGQEHPAVAAARTSGSCRASHSSRARENEASMLNGPPQSSVRRGSARASSSADLGGGAGVLPGDGRSQRPRLGVDEEVGVDLRAHAHRAKLDGTGR